MQTIQANTTGRKAAVSIEEFCESHGISRTLFYELLKVGKAPRVMRVLGRRLVSDEAAREWRARMTENAA